MILYLDFALSAPLASGSQVMGWRAHSYSYYARLFNVLMKLAHVDTACIEEEKREDFGLGDNEDETPQSINTSETSQELVLKYLVD